MKHFCEQTGNWPGAPEESGSGARPSQAPDVHAMRVMGQNRTQRGTTLLEILIAVVVITTGMLGFFTLHIRSHRVAASAQRTAQATALASSKQNALMAIPFSSTLTSAGLVPTLFPSCGSWPPVDRLADLCNVETVNAMGTTNPSQGQLIFRRSWAVVVADGESGQSTLDMMVRVRYSAEDGRCPECTNSSLKVGYKALTVRTQRSLNGN